MSIADRTAVRKLARGCGLKLLSADKLSWRRERRGKGFVYLDDQGRVIRDAATRARLNALAVPPAYTDVRLAADPCAHLQATGRDDAGRLQYRYHPHWVEVREAVKAKRLQILEVVRDIAGDLSNTPTVARKSYVHATVVAAFEKGPLHRLSDRIAGKRLSPRREMLLRALVGGA